MYKLIQVALLESFASQTTELPLMVVGATADAYWYTVVHQLCTSI